jgi:hypothetical protein
MDADVLAAIARWPNVPGVYGWLSLTARGEWRLRGERIGNAAIRAFFDRNYASDTLGRWYVQNGPQRVYVALEATPWIYRLDAQGVSTHTGLRPERCGGAALLDDGRLLLLTDLGCGIVDDRDSARCLDAVTDLDGQPLSADGLARWIEGELRVSIDPARLRLQGSPQRVEHLAAGAAPSRFGFVRDPRPAD